MELALPVDAATALGAFARTWGTTAAERSRPFACDRWLAEPRDALFRAVDVAAPPQVLFRWLCQMKVAPYSYDWIDNLGRPSPRQLTPGVDALAVGQRFMGSFELVEFERDEHLTVVLQSAAAERLFGRFAVTYAVFPREPALSRVVVKLLVQYPAGPLGWILRRIAPWADLVMMRRQLLNLKTLAEAQWNQQPR